MKNKNDFGDNVISFLADILSCCSFNDIDKMILQSDPLPFTSSRIICSIAKGWYMSNKNVEVIFISSFLTYLDIVSKYKSTGIMMISKDGKDFFTCEYNNGILGKIIVQNHEVGKAIDVNDIASADVNLAKKQREVLGLGIACKNPHHISSILSNRNMKY
jgi:tRNA A37 threonylcarbamoyladenosine modification protein TsaB